MKTSSRNILFLTLVLQSLLTRWSVEAFSSTTSSLSTSHFQRATQLYASPSAPDDDISRQLERAKALLAKTKAKLEAKQEEELNGKKQKADEPKVPFFASKTTSNKNKKAKVIKSTNEQGLITTDGEKMAKLSESEEWEFRSLVEVFRNERAVKEDSLANRDVAASILGLQRVLQTEDYKKIFDPRNRFIGEP